MIGIKIADGSFYPILEEGVPGEKKLEVTTARDKQTTVQINLYRSESGKMEDADYVDTLLIDNLKPHQKEEPSFDLIVKIDENNMLSAEIDDPETGEKSDTKVSLVNMGNKSIFDDPDYTVSSDDLPKLEETKTSDSLDNMSKIDEFSLPNLDDEQFTADSGDFTLPDFDSFEAPEEPTENEETPVETDIPTTSAGESSEEIPVAAEEEFSLAESLSDIPDLADNAQTTDEIPSLDDFTFAEESSTPEIATDNSATNDDFSFTKEPDVETTTESSEVSDDFSFSGISDSEITAEETSAESDDFSFDFPEDSVTEVASENTSAKNDDFSFDLPEEPVTEEPVAEAVLSDDDFSFSTDFMDDEKDVDDDEKPFSFDSLPDFDEIPELANSSGNSESAMDDDLDIDFSIPEDNDMRKNNYNDTYSDYSEQPEYEYASSGGMQNALFGGDDLFEETKKQKERKNLVSVIICILCALISLCVLGVILYLTPSIMKIVGGKQEEKTVIETSISDSERQSIVAEEEVQIEEQPVRKAEENKIVVMNETIPPVVPENNTPQTEIPSIIRHLVKWGDTLWDLAGFYYRNPWLYRIISDANNIKNPDLIISGTYLTIPER